jgi:hypothetical protein
MADIINITLSNIDETTTVALSDHYEVINVTVSDAVLNITGTGTSIDGFSVIKGAGNISTQIEVGDKIWGFIDNVFIAGLVTNTPVNDVSDVNIAVQGEYLS